jgi:succinoglycan biosynthesis protein ExoM
MRGNDKPPLESEVTVCIATCRRPTGLERLLSSLLNQHDAPPFDVIIVDNDPTCSARPVIARYTGRLAITYDCEPQRGISSVRNRCVALSRAQLLAFIDDDEWAEPYWLAALVEKMQDPSISAAVGVRTYVFAEDVPVHRRTCLLFAVPRFADGEPLPWPLTSIANACIRRSALPHNRNPFDPSLNLIGGEDSHLFAGIIARGGRVVGARDAVTREYRSGRRAAAFGLLGRAFRHGGTGVEIDWHDKPAWRRLGFAFNAAVRFAGNLCFAIVSWPGRREYSFQRAIIAAGWAGRAGRVLGWRFSEYRRVQGE